MLTATVSQIVKRPGRALVILITLSIAATVATMFLRVNANQLDLMRQDLPQVKEVRRLIDMVGGAGHITLALRCGDQAQLRAAMDGLAARIKADKEHVRYVSYRLPLDVVREHIGLFVKPADLLEAKRRINLFIRDRLKRASPFFMEIEPTKPVELHLDDLIAKYTRIGQNRISDDYMIADHIGKLAIKPTWDTNDLSRTRDYLLHIKRVVSEYAASNSQHLRLVESYKRDIPPSGTLTYGFTGTYVLVLDDTRAIESSLAEISLLALLLIGLITLGFFRSGWPTVIVLVGTVLGTLLAMGFAWLAFGELNMITSILGGILLGFGVDYGIQFLARLRLELTRTPDFDEAVESAFVGAGRPAFVTAIVTAGTFLTLAISDFKGFSQFGVLCAAGTLLIAGTLFIWCPAVLLRLERWQPGLGRRVAGVARKPTAKRAPAPQHIPAPRLLLGVSSGVVISLLLVASPWWPGDSPHGIRFDYDSSALSPTHQTSVELQDELRDHFGTTDDSVAIYSPTVADAKRIYDAVANHPERYPSVAQPPISMFTFIPPAKQAKANAEVLKRWRAELADIDLDSLPPEQQDQMHKFFKALDARPYGLDALPKALLDRFRELPSARPENHGFLTYLAPRVDLRNGKQLLEFSDEVEDIRGPHGAHWRAAGPAVLYATLARTILRDGLNTVLLALLWILIVHFADFRSVKLALASVVPLILGLGSTLGVVVLLGQQLNFMNIVMLPILLGFGISHGLYLLHRVLEGSSARAAFRTVGAAVAASTLTTIAGFSALLVAQHRGLQSMGMLACVGLAMTLFVSFTLFAALLELIQRD